MSVFRRMLALAVVCLASFSAAQVPDQVVAERVLGPHWRQMARVSGMIFSGTVLGIESRPAGKGTPLPLMIVRVRADRGMIGVRTGEVLTVREWAGAWSMQRAMTQGERVLLFLYPPSRLGLTSPVGGRFGQVPLDSRGEIVAVRVLATSGERERTSGAEQFPEKLDSRRSVPEGASDSSGLAVSLKRYSDTNLCFSANCEAAVNSAGFAARLKSCPPENRSGANLRAAGSFSFAKISRQQMRNCATGIADPQSEGRFLTQPITLAQLERAIRTARFNPAVNRGRDHVRPTSGN